MMVSDDIYLLILLSIYATIKFIFYRFWCIKSFSYLEVSITNTTNKQVIKKWGSLLGLVRTLIGILFGMIFYWVGGSKASVEYILPHSIPLASLLIILRWIEWSIMDAIISKKSRVSMINFLIGSNSQSRKWRSFGIIISFLADASLALIPTFTFIYIINGVGRIC